MRFDAAIFDLDGTLIDSMGVWEKIDVDFLEKRGIPVPPDYIGEITAMGFRQAAHYTIRRFGLPDTTDALIREWNQMALYEYGHNILLKPYAKEYLDLLKSKCIRLAIATSLPARLYEPVLKNRNIRGYFDAIVSTDDVQRGKEFPDVFVCASEKLSTQPERCLVFEDVLPAIRSAKLAGMKVYGVYDDSSKEHEEEIKGIADGFIYDFRDAPLPPP